VRCVYVVIGIQCMQEVGDRLVGGGDYGMEYVSQMK